jgi:hypothetical protein
MTVSPEVFVSGLPYMTGGFVLAKTPANQEIMSLLRKQPISGACSAITIERI